MAERRGAAVLENLGALFSEGTAAGLTDEQLLARFSAERGASAERAFAALVDRHGPMVLRTCRGVLGRVSEADDAFQATFLVLARRAGGLWVRDSLGPWLHRVAFRIALRARAAGRRRDEAESRAASLAVGWVEGTEPDDLGPVLHEEIERLPGRQRDLVVLCHLEGQSIEEAARQVGCPIGTAKSRLARARQRLRERLERRGLAPSVALLAPVARRKVSEALANATARQAAGGAVSGAVPAAVGALVHGELRSLIMTKWTMAAALAAGLAILGAGAMAQSRHKAPAPVAAPAAIPEPASRSEPGTKPSAPEPQPEYIVGGPIYHTNGGTKPSAPEPQPAPETGEGFSRDRQARLESINADMEEIMAVGKMFGELQVATAAAEFQAQLLDSQLRAYGELLEKANFGVPRDLSLAGSAEAEEQAKAVSEVVGKVERLIEKLAEARALQATGRLTRNMLAAKHPEFFTDEIEVSPSPPPADQERRLRELEEKLDRVLEALESRGISPDEPTSTDDAPEDR